MRATDLVSVEEAGTLPALFRRRTERSGSKTAYIQYDRKKTQWQTYSWREVELLARRWQSLLAESGLEPSDRVALLCPNSVEWVAIEQATLGLGLILVPLFVSDNPQNIAYLLDDSAAAMLIAHSGQAWTRVAEAVCEVKSLRQVLCLDAAGATLSGHGVDVRAVGDDLPHCSGPFIDQTGDPDALATLIYTSGTTGRPKGVMLSHRNLLWASMAAARAVSPYEDDVFLSFLPLAHIFERTVGHFLPMLAGSRVAFARSSARLAEDLIAIRPTVLISVPRVYDRAYTAITRQMRGRPLRRSLLDWTIALGWRQFESEQRRGPPLDPVRQAIWRFLDWAVARRVRERFGGRLRAAVSGGAPIFPEVPRFFLALGVHMLEGYGLTESASAATGNRLEDNRPGTVGPPLPDVEVLVDDTGEILVRGPNVMLGYWERPEATRAAIDAKGWLHTGDLGTIEDGYLVVRGRLKEIIVTSTGEKVPPEDVETAILLDPLFQQAMVVGEGRPHLAALLVLHPQGWREFATSIGLDPDEPGAIESTTARRAVRRRLDLRLAQFPAFARVLTVGLTLEPWTVENGLMTTTLKIRRAEIEKRFSAKIAALYRHADGTQPSIRAAPDR